MLDHRYWYCEALRKLGHRYNNPPTALVERMLLPFCKTSLPSGKMARRKALVEAAKAAIDGAKQGPKVSVQMRTVAVSDSKDKDFYASWEWKAARYAALKQNGRRCQCCGWQPGDTADGWLVVDHIRPRRKFPELELALSNLQVLCNDCNMGKSNRYTDDFRGMESWVASIGRR